MKRKRKAIPARKKALLQKEINSLCPICENEEVDHFQIHHIDENPENDEFDNLLMLCPIYHSKITKGDIHRADVILLKQSLRKRFEEMAEYIQSRIDGTRLAKINRSKQQLKNYQSFDEYTADQKLSGNHK